MHATLEVIGDSQCVRLPKSVVKKAHLSKDLDVEVIDGSVVIRPVRKLREGWADAAVLCRQSGEDVLHEWDTVTNDFAGDWQ